MAAHPQHFPGMEVGAATALTTITASSTTAFLGTDRFCLMLVHVLCPVGITVTGVTSTGRLAGVTWVQASTFHPGAGQGGEIWIGYGVPDSESTATTTVVATYSASASKRVILVSWLRFNAPQTAPVVGASAGANGSGTVATAGPLTPAVDDIVLFVHYHDANTGPPAYSGAPAGQLAQLLVPYQSSQAPLRRHQMDFRKASSAVAHSRTYTITSAVWVDEAVILTPQYATVAEDGHTYKGRDLASLDTAGAL